MAHTLRPRTVRWYGTIKTLTLILVHVRPWSFWTTLKMSLPMNPQLLKEVSRSLKLNLRYLLLLLTSSSAFFHFDYRGGLAIVILCFCLQGVTKGLVAERVLSTMINSNKAPDFVLCIGDDRSDEDMFESISSISYSSSLASPPKIFACTVGQKPSKAKYYLDDTTDVLTLLQSLATPSTRKLRPSFETRVLFEDDV